MASTMICMSSRSWRIRIKEVLSLVSKTLSFFFVSFFRLDICDIEIVG